MSARFVAHAQHSFGRSFLTLRGLRYHYLRWENPDARPLLLLHGARDSAVTFQFMVEALKGSWNIIAPDWRGHGHSAHTPMGYWVHDFMADLDGLIDLLFPQAQPDVVAHSMGGNIVQAYAGIRPGRIKRIVSLDALGPPGHRLPVEMVTTLTEYLTPPRTMRGYRSQDQVAARLCKANHRLTSARAAFLAVHSTGLRDDGCYHWLFDPAMTRSYPTLHTLAEWGAIWKNIDIPVRWITSSDQGQGTTHFDDATVAERHALLPHAQVSRLAGTGHNLHHDRPEDVAALVEDFLLQEAG